jgi:hypothetical protein
MLYSLRMLYILSVHAISIQWCIAGCGASKNTISIDVNKYLLFTKIIDIYLDNYVQSLGKYVHSASLETHMFFNFLKEEFVFGGGAVVLLQHQSVGFRVAAFVFVEVDEGYHSY